MSHFVPKKFNTKSADVSYSTEKSFRNYSNFYCVRYFLPYKGKYENHIAFVLAFTTMMAKETA